MKMPWWIRLQKWWATRRAVKKALRGEGINVVEAALLKERYHLSDDDFIRRDDV